MNRGGMGNPAGLRYLVTMADFPKKTPADWEKLAAKELRDKPVSSLELDVEHSVEPVRLALLGPEGPTGTFTRWENVTIPW